MLGTWAYVIISELGAPHYHPMVLGYSPSKSGTCKLVGLPNVLALALHQVNYLGWMDRGDHSWYRTILLLKVRVN